MPFPSPGNFDQASQISLLAVKAKTDLIGASVALEGGGNVAAIKAKTDVLFIDSRVLNAYPQPSSIPCPTTGGSFSIPIMFLVPVAGLSIAYTIHCSSGVGLTMSGQIYRNGVAVGTTRSINTGDTQTYTETILFFLGDVLTITGAISYNPGTPGTLSDVKIKTG